MELSKYIDHTLLAPEATEAEIKRICEEAKQYNFASVCINPCWVALASSLLKDSDVKVCTVIGFPLGANTTATKVFETENAIDNGAQECDMVINIGQLKSGNVDFVQNDISEVVKVAHNKGALVKVIIEASLLDDDEIVIASQLAKNAGADFVKTSTGFSTGGATVHDVALMRETVGPDMGVKASGGIHSREEAQAMIDAGATRIGASAGIRIVKP